MLHSTYGMERFRDEGTEDIYNGRNTPAARRTLPEQFHAKAAKKIDLLFIASALRDLRYPPGNHLHDLGRDRKGQWAIKINGQYRVCFIWNESEGARLIEITDYH